MYLVVIAATDNIALKNAKKNISTGDAKGIATGDAKGKGGGGNCTMPPPKYAPKQAPFLKLTALLLDLLCQ